MPEKRSKRPAVKDTGRRDLTKSAGACVFLAIFFYLLYYYLQTKNSLIWAAHIAQHLSIAFTVGLISIVGLEYNARKRAERDREQLSLDVFGAVLGRFVPDPFVKEITEVLRHPFAKRQCKYNLTFLEPRTGMQAGYCILQRETEFLLENLLEKPQDFTVKSRYYATDLIPPSLKEGAFHNALFVRKVRVDENEEHKFFLEHTFTLGPREKVHVLLRGEEPARISTGGSSYIQMTPADGLEISINNRCADLISEITVQMFHPGGAEQVEHNADVAPQYVLRRAFLPGQGFEVRWKGAEAVSELPRSA